MGINGLPSLRPLEAVPIEHEGERMMALVDPTRYIETPMVVSIPAFYVLTLLDGEHDVDLICEKFQKRFRQPIAREDVIGLIDQMDSALMLDNERFARHREEARRQFMERPDRPAAFAGVSYADDPSALSEYLDGLLADVKDGGGEDIKAIVAPHIDFRVGADMMASGWKRAAKSGADLFIILGIGHGLENDFFACVDKDFTTPVGAMRVDRPFLNELREISGKTFTRTQRSTARSIPSSFSRFSWRACSQTGRRSRRFQSCYRFPKRCGALIIRSLTASA